MSIPCSVGVMAYNEEQNIVPLIYALLAQRTGACEVLEIIVVASGCTDRTVELAEEVAAAHPVVRVEAQAERSGKAAAINRLIELARGEVIVLAGADTLPDPTAIEALVEPFADPDVGMTGGRIVPLNDPHTPLGFAVQTLWHMHHQMALRWPKLGELVAFRNVVAALPTSAATDEVALEALITTRGYRLVYVPEALVYNRGPQTAGEFLAQRRRIFAGHLQIAASQGYVAASMPAGHLLALFFAHARRHPLLLPRLLLTGALELLARALGALDYWRGHSHHIWRRVGSTKAITEGQGAAERQALTLVALQCPDGSVRPDRLIGRRVPPSVATLCWWDSWHHQMLFRLRDPDEAAGVGDQVRELASYISDGSQGISYRVISFGQEPALVEREVGAVAGRAREGYAMPEKPLPLARRRQWQP
jgi:biofilm PGA synthesis N-glycosyltransferase PgaC